MVGFEVGKKGVFKDKMIKEGKWNLLEDVDQMLNEMAHCI